MPRLLKTHTIIFMTIFMIIVMNSPVFGQTNVTILFNSSTNRDTLSENHIVQIRGEATGTVVPAVTWDDNSEIFMDNIGGDYWQTTIQMNPGDTMKYKFWTGFDISTGTFFWSGWEGPLVPVEPIGGGNRILIAGENDTTLALQFYNGNETELDQYWRPYESKADTFAVYFRVNMAGVLEDESFDPENDEPVVVRGGPPIDPTDPWDVDVVLQREDPISESLQSPFYSGAVYLANTDVTPGMTQQFKFVYRNGTVWESRPDRTFNYSAAKDTTIHWVFFDDKVPTGISLVEATLVWRLKTGALEKLGYFDRNIDIGIVIDGAKAWATDLDEAIQLEYAPLAQEWIAEETFKKQPGASMEYKAVVRFDSSRIDPESDNYIPGLDVVNYWEEPTVTGSGNRLYTYSSITTQNMPGDLGKDYQFFNGLPAEGVINNDITITFNINMAPATVVETNPSNPLFVPGDSVWVLFYGGLMPLTQGQGLYDNEPIPLEDVDSDNVYSGSISLTGPTVFDVGYRVRYKEPSGGYVENGGGFAKGRSYYQFIPPTAVHGDGTIEWPTEYSFPVLNWKDSDLPVEEIPDLWTPTGINPNAELVVQKFELSPNYPNPFNPNTTIKYQVAHHSQVKIEVYNLAGQLVATLIDKQLPQGKYTVQWNGRDMNGKSVASGMYFVKMKAADFEKVNKIMLLK
jgi:hypothetical protein